MKRKTHDTEAQWGNYTELRNRKDQMKLRQTVTDLYDYARASLAGTPLLALICSSSSPHWTLGVDLD